MAQDGAVVEVGVVILAKVAYVFAYDTYVLVGGIDRSRRHAQGNEYAGYGGVYAGIEHEKPYHSAYYEVKHLGLNLQHCASGEQHQQSDGCIAYEGHVDVSGIEGRYDYYAADVIDYGEGGQKYFERRWHS